MILKMTFSIFTPNPLLETSLFSRRRQQLLARPIYDLHHQRTDRYMTYNALIPTQLRVPAGIRSQSSTNRQAMITMHCAIRATAFALAALSSCAAGFTTSSSPALARKLACSNPHSSVTSTSALSHAGTTPPNQYHSPTAFALHSVGKSKPNTSSLGKGDANIAGLSVPLLYALASAGLVYKSCRATGLADKVILLASAALSLFNISNADRKRLIAANKANQSSFGIGTISTTEEVDVAEQKRYAAERFKAALLIKTLGQVLGIMRMIMDQTPAGGAALFMTTQIIYFAIGGGKYRHADDGQLDPIEERLVLGASTTYAMFTLTALAAGRLPSGTVGKGIATIVYCFGCLTGAFDGIMSLFFGGRLHGRRAR